MLLPRIRLILGTTYRDLHAEREYLLKRTLPLFKRRCEEQGILCTIREIKWATEPEIISRQMNRFLAEIADPDAIYIGLRSTLSPPATRFELAALIAEHHQPTIDRMISEGASWQMIEQALVSHVGAATPGAATLSFTPESHGLTRTTPEQLGASVEAALQHALEDRVAAKNSQEADDRSSADGRPSADGRSSADGRPSDAVTSSAYHRLYLQSRAEGALRSATKADELIDVLSDAQGVVLLGVTGSGKSTTIALALETLAAEAPASGTPAAEALAAEALAAEALAAEAPAAEAPAAAALAANRKRVISYVLDGAESSAQAVSNYIRAAITDPASIAADPFCKLSIALSRAGETLIALDGIEFLDTDSRLLGWLPNPLPRNIQIIASTTDPRQAEALELKGWCTIRVEELDPDRAGKLIEHLCSLKDLWLTNQQKRSITEHPLAFHPQFLITLIDELCQFGWFTQLNKNLDEYLDEASIHHLFSTAKKGASAESALPNSIILSARLQYYLQAHSLVELYQKVLERLEYDFGAPQITRALSYIASSTYGLSVNDLASLAGLAPQTLQHILNALGANVTARNGRLLIGNEYFGKAIANRYMNAASVRTAVRTSLIHFLRIASADERLSADERTSDPIHTMELATQYLQAEDRRALQDLLLDPRSFMQLASRVQFDTLSSYWKAVKPDSLIDKLYLEALPKFQKITDLSARVALLRTVVDFLLYLAKPAAANTILSAAIESTSDHQRMSDHPRMSDQPHLVADRAQLFRSLGRTLYSLAKYEDAEAAYRASFEVFTTLGADFEAEALASHKELAQLLAEGARYPEADALYTEILRDTERIYGDESPELAAVLNNIGLMLNGQGKYDAAISVAARARNIYVHHWGREYPELGWCYHIFATAYRQKGDLVEASQWYAQAIERFVQMHGEEHPIPLRSMYGYAVLLQRTGDLAGSVTHARKVVALRTKLLGANHADTAAAKVLLGSVLKASGEYAEAMKLLAEGLEVFDNGANKEHPEVARTLHELGEVYGKLDMLDKAKPALLRAAAIRTKVLGIEHPDTLATTSLIDALTTSISSPAIKVG